VETPPDEPPPGTERREGEAILAFLGDVAPARSIERQLARYGSAYPWLAMGPLLRDADLAVANLECVLTAQGKALDKQYLMRAHPGSGATLAEAGLDLVTLANNHALDYGQVGLAETLDTLAGLGIDAIGAGRSRDEAHQPAIYTLNGVRVAVLGYAAARWDGSSDVPATDRIAWGRPAQVQADVRAVRDRVDVVVVQLHAGTEYAGEPSPDQVAVARAAVDAGADLVVGHHPHVTQTIERYGQGLIVYSLGDALFDIPLQAALRGDLLRVHVTKEGLAQAEIWPFWIDRAVQPRLLDNGQGQPRYRIIYP
jgi:poly-gamma-glutamate synthesis protein (capsule biosynthesis protein)